MSLAELELREWMIWKNFLRNFVITDSVKSSFANEKEAPSTVFVEAGQRPIGR
ncbi:hypothetical protein [Paenibacillus radicis (ex Gao et al. 2016)]|uniref:Uncharacterized protein n=1 Tax=Paenibacillus radicis (ex Gao et al. 2016) TaxID=1737354 RepID=A0A917MA89_9BACL|nr:hypothetical protein [Paenibacillus radicis (ex Gao et al. 2016)]GGG87741.1 hypothetical protein GCM10010918_52590 [Paenibacillus radicis (ex Gao et al. 2016)]